MTEVIGQVMFEIRREKMANSKYAVRVLPYLGGQLRIQLCNYEDVNDEDHGQIVREMCTYKHATMMSRVTMLAMADEPEELAQTWATEKNCESAGGRIRLDQ